MHKAYGECARSGRRLPLHRLVKDGQTGALVADDWYESKHPQEIAPVLRAERHTMPAPELSKPDGEGTAAPALEWDDTGRLV